MANRAPNWPLFRKVWRRAELTDRMIEALAVSPIIAARIDKGNAYHNACTICLTCSVATACRNWLDESQYPALPPDFCPNAQFFRTCIANKSK